MIGKKRRKSGKSSKEKTKENAPSASSKSSGRTPQAVPGISFHAWGMRNEQRKMPQHVLGGHPTGKGKRYDKLDSRNEDKLPPGKFVAPGKFGRMFPDLAALNADEAALRELGEALADQNPSDPAGDNPNVPAGYTYLGQFIDHDITFDTTSLQEKLIDPLSLRNFRTPALDLDCLYGSGRVAQPYLYGRGDDSDLFVIGATQTGGGDPSIPAGLPNDLPRAPNRFALIGDPRNDENLVVQQLHLAMLKFHNKVVAGLRDGSIPQESPLRKSVFDEARDLVIWHYQWIVLHDFLPRIVRPEVIKDVLREGRKFYRWEDSAREPFMPVEFSVAAYRLGHSMVREEYDYNRVFTPLPGGVVPATLSLLFTFTGLSGAPDNPQVPTPSDWIIDWRRFFPVSDPSRVGFSRRLDPFMAPTLAALPNVPPPNNSLAVRNLLRGRVVGLPPGQSVARFMKISPLTPDQIAQGPDGAVAKKHNLHIETPLWYYILKEAEQMEQGKCLGELGSRILAEVFIGLLEGDASSFLARKRDWRPSLPASAPASFTMADLLRFVNDVNPIGD